MRIQHNIMAINAYRNYNTNNKALSGNLEKLSSGYKINRAGDDAAQKNVKDGISLVKTAEGAMQEIQDMLNRMDYLATQSANGTYDNEVDRANLQKEVDALKTEINRIADSANFNGIKLLDGSQDSTFKTTGNTDVIADTAQIITDGQLGKDTQAGVYSIDFSKTKITAADDNVDVKLTIFGEDLSVTLQKSGQELEGADLAKAFASEWNKAANQLTDKWKDNYGFDMTASVEGDKLVFTMSDAPTKEWTLAANAATTGKLATYNADTGVLGNNAEEVTVTTEKEAVDATNVRLYAQASFELAKVGEGGAGKVEVGDGTSLTIGDTTYVFAVGTDSKYKGLNNVIDLTDKTETSDDLVKTAASRLSTAAKNNANFKVGNTLVNGKITITEKEGGVDYTKNNLAGKDGKGTGGNGVAAAKKDAILAELNLLPADDEEDLVRRYALTDSQWAQIQPLLPPESVGRGRAFKSNRLMLDGILFQLRTGTAWSSLPKCFGRPRCVADRLRLWKRTGVWERVEEQLVDFGLLDENEGAAL